MPKDIQEILQIFLFSATVTSVLIYMFEVYIPFVDEVTRVEYKCKQAGGLMLDTREGAMCINKTIFIK